MLELDGGGRLVDLLTAGAGALEEVLYEVGVEEGCAWGERLGEARRGGVHGRMGADDGRAQRRQAGEGLEEPHREVFRAGGDIAATS